MKGWLSAAQPPGLVAIYPQGGQRLSASFALFCRLVPMAVFRHGPRAHSLLNTKARAMVADALIDAHPANPLQFAGAGNDSLVKGRSEKFSLTHSLAGCMKEVKALLEFFSARVLSQISHRPKAKAAPRTTEMPPCPEKMHQIPLQRSCTKRVQLSKQEFCKHAVGVHHPNTQACLTPPMRQQP